PSPTDIYTLSLHDALPISASESLSQDFGRLSTAYVEGWREYRSRCVTIPGVSTSQIYESSIAVLKSHQSKKPPGGLVASLGIPRSEEHTSELQSLAYLVCR